MSSSADRGGPNRGGRAPGDRFLFWNRRLHYFIGLYLLFFSWLFAFTGLLLNHPKWEFAQFWPNRHQRTEVHDVQPPAGGSDLARARGLMRQLDLAGEIQWPARRPPDGVLAFQIVRPGHMVDVKASTSRATLHHTELNAWGTMNVLHTFIGVRSGDPADHRDWALTTIWALAMDAVALGLIVMVFGSYVMWFRLKGKRRGGLLALSLGCFSCGLFVVALRWII